MANKLTLTSSLLLVVSGSGEVRNKKMFKKIKLYFIKKKYGIRNQDELSYQEMIQDNITNGYHPKIKWVNLEEEKEEKEKNRKKFIKYQLMIQSKKFNL